MSRKVSVFLGMLLFSAIAQAESTPTPIALGIPLSGVVQQVMVEAGDRVESGQELLRLDPRRYQIRMRRAEAQLEQVEAELRLAEEELADEQDLFERLVTSERGLRDAQHRVATIRAQVEQRRAERDEAALDLELSVLRAPLAGVVLERRSSPGEVVSGSDHPQILILLGVE